LRSTDVLLRSAQSSGNVTKSSGPTRKRWRGGPAEEIESLRDETEHLYKTVIDYQPYKASMATRSVAIVGETKEF
jgi:hypothetical protein